MKTFSSQLKEVSCLSIMEMATAAMNKNRLKEARDLFVQMIDKEDQSDEAWVGLARIHRSESNKDLSRACLLRGLDENPYNREAIINLHDWIREDGVEMNRTLFKNYLDKHPEDRDVLKLADESMSSK